MSDPVLDPLREQALRAPQSICVMSPERDYSFAELDVYCEQVRSMLSRQGVAAGECVGLALQPSVAFIAYLFALSRLGAVAVCLNTRNPASGLTSQLRAVCAERVIRDADVLECASGDMLPADSIALPAAQPCTIVFTSGSMGVSKAVLHSFGNHVAASGASNAHNGLAPGDRWLLSLPCFHVAGLGIIYRCLTAGATIVLAPESGLRDATMECRVSHLSVVPTQLRRLLDDPMFVPDEAALVSVLVGGDTCPQSLIDSALGVGLPVRRTYGMTETTSQITSVSPEDAARACDGHSGTALPGVGVRISDGDHIEVRGDTLCLGYVDGRRATLPLTADGWFRTGDTGMLSAEGHLTVTGRSDNMFISGGENIHPEEIEQALCALPDILQACVVPVEDSEFGHRPVAFVETRQEPADGNALNDALSDELPGYKLPVRYLAWPQDLSGMKMRRSDFAQRV